MFFPACTGTGFCRNALILADFTALPIYVKYDNLFLMVC